MKKYLLYAGIAAAAFTSCQNEEVVDFASGDTINFRTSMGLNDVTRGSEIAVSNEVTTTNMQQFKVTAFQKDVNNWYTSNLFDRVTFKRFEESSEFKSDKTYLWYEGADLAFYAYSYLTTKDEDIDETKIGEIEITDMQHTINNFSPQPKVKDQIDLVVAYGKATYEDNRKEAIELSFKHILSQLVVKAKTDNKTYDFYVKGVKFCNVYYQGNWEYDEGNHSKGKLGIPGVGDWYEKTNQKTSYETTRYTTPIKLNSDAQYIGDVIKNNEGNIIKHEYPMVLPQELNSSNLSTDAWGQYVAVLLQIRTKETDLQVFPVGNEGKYAWACIPLYIENADVWRPGHRITYILDFTNGAGYTDPNPDPYDPDTPDEPYKGGDPILDGLIKFTVSVKEWTADPYIEKDLIGPNTTIDDKNNFVPVDLRL